MKEPPLLKLMLGRAISDTVGHSWPVVNSAPTEITAIESDRLLCVFFPSGRTWTTHSRVTFLSQRGGVVSSIVISPLPAPQVFNVALETVRLAAEELGVAKEPAIAAKLDEWSTHPQAWSPFATHVTGCALEPGVTLFIEIKPGSKAAEWYVTYHLTDDSCFIDGSRSGLREKGGSPKAEAQKDRHTP
jgi:hypothetical protein